MIKKIISLLLAVLCGMSAVSCADEASESVFQNTTAVVHGAGELYGYDRDGVWRSFYGSNSLEGLENCRDGGATAVELDFSFTSDGKLVCLHNWSPEYIYGIEEGVPLTREEFMSSEIFWNFTPIDSSYVMRFLAKNKDMYLVTDIKQDFDTAAALIAREFAEIIDRVVVQIYSTEQYDTVRELGFTNVILTLYGMTWEEKTDTSAIVKFARSNPLTAITFPKQLCELDGYVGKLKKAGVPLFVHTVNDSAEVLSYAEMGVGVYTDTVPAM